MSWFRAPPESHVCHQASAHLCCDKSPRLQSACVHLFRYRGFPDNLDECRRVLLGTYMYVENSVLRCEIETHLVPTCYHASPARRSLSAQTVFEGAAHLNFGKTRRPLYSRLFLYKLKTSSSWTAMCDTTTTYGYGMNRIILVKVNVLSVLKVATYKRCTVPSHIIITMQWHYLYNEPCAYSYANGCNCLSITYTTYDADGSMSGKSTTRHSMYSMRSC